MAHKSFLIVGEMKIKIKLGLPFDSTGIGVVAPSPIFTPVSVGEDIHYKGTLRGTPARIFPWGV